MSNLHDKFSQKVQNFVEKNNNKIKKYFQINGIISKETDTLSLLEDKKILYVTNPTPDNNFYLEIYNIAAAFRFDNGFFQLINNLNTIVSIFNNKYMNETPDNKKRQFSSLFESIENQDSEKIDEIIGINFDEDKLYDIKLGLDKLVKYFGLENIQIYYEKELNINSVMAATGIITFPSIVAGVASGILAGSALLGTGIGLGVGLIIGIVSLIFIKWTRPKIIVEENGIDKKKVENNKNKIEDLFYMIKSFYTNQIYKKKNVIIVAIDKSNENYNDFIMYGTELDYLNSVDCPKKATPGTNREYYDICFELMKEFIDKYDEMFKNNRAILEKEVKKDFELLKCKETLPELKIILDKIKQKKKDPLQIVASDSSKLSSKKHDSKETDYESKKTNYTSHSIQTKEKNDKNIGKIQQNYA